MWFNQRAADQHDRGNCTSIDSTERLDEVQARVEEAFVVGRR